MSNAHAGCLKVNSSRIALVAAVGRIVKMIVTFTLSLPVDDNQLFIYRTADQLD